IIGDVFTPTSLKRMGLVETKVDVNPATAKSRGRRIPLKDYPLWSKADDPEAIRIYLDDLKQQGFVIDVDEFLRNLQDPPDFESPRKK
ncbi:hypothetical protein, partial [Pseudomonas syringae]|uniref:hypothetical protein n=1 Tax=Pseudomonas syringae TaxID=317 RepID=UPI0034D794D3